MKNIRKQTYTLEQYLKDMKSEKIRTDQECQRLSGQWNPNMINELVASVLTDDYIPPVILGEEKATNGIVRQWIVDGLQRSSTLSLFRYGNVKITKNLDEYMVAYQTKATDENGKVKRDDRGEIIWKNVEYDIRNKTYEQLPEELKEVFNGYQLEIVVYQDCDTTKISKLVRKLNNCKPMNQAQRAFTYIDVFAREIREITENRFFKDMYSCNSRDRINGTFERTIGDMVILCEYPEQYRKDTKASFKWLNENGTIMDFDNLNDLLTRLVESTEITGEVRELFNKKNAYIFVAAFKAFTELGREDEAFGEFLHWFLMTGKNTEINGKAWTDYDLDRSTKDSGVVHGKLDYLTALINQYFAENQSVA